MSDTTECALRRRVPSLIGRACALALAGASFAGAADEAFDGPFSGEAVTSFGGGICGQSWALGGTVSGSRIDGTAVRGPETYELNGKVEGGKVKWDVFGAGASATGRGRVEGDVATGSWFDNTRRDCEGTFTLRRGG